MPEVQEVFRMATQKVRPDPGAMERQRRKQRWRAGRQKAALYALTAGLAIVGLVVGIRALTGTDERPATPPAEPQGSSVRGDPPTAEQLEGAWVSDSSSLMFEFTSDGRFTADDGGLLDTDPWGRGTYEVDGGIVTFEIQRSPQEGGLMCWRWDAGLSGDGRLETVVRDDPRDACQAFAGMEIAFIRVSPRSPAADVLDADVSEADWGTLPLATGSATRGIWLLEGGDHLLRLSTNGTYALDGDGTLASDPDDLGTFEFDVDEGVITLTSGADSRACSEGDVTVWTDARYGGGAIRGEAGRSDCAAHRGLDGTWVRISH